MSRDVEGDDDKDDKELRARVEGLGCGKVVDLPVVVVVSVLIVVMEEEPLRSDTRLPLESSPYMAGNLYNDQLVARSNAFLFLSFPFQHSHQLYRRQCFPNN